MSNNNRKPCKFFVQGACLKGENCKFLHHRKDPPKNICKLYQKGFCPYGSHCKYEHVQTSWVKSSSSAAAATDVASSSSALSTASHQSLLPNSFSTDIPSNNIATLAQSTTVKPEDRLLCSVAAAGGNCPNEDKCYYIHGDLCPTCGKHCLHPYRVEEREEHLKTCKENQKQLEALRSSQEIQCSVCLDQVLSKPSAAERRFAVLPECDHPFCISCIRSWRKSSRNLAVRACPICRKTSHFVVPSLVWYSCKEEKQEIIDNYKAKLRSIDCKHFDFGNGNCPFGINCFYKHTVKPGSYTWKYNTPPPRRPVHRRSNEPEMDASFDVFEHLIEDNMLDFFDSDDFDEQIFFNNDPECDIYDYDEDLRPFDMTLLLASLELSDFSSDEDDDFY